MKYLKAAEGIYTTVRISIELIGPSNNRFQQADQ